MNQTENVHGTIERIIYHSTDTGFTVFVLQLNRTKKTTVTGNFPRLNPGEHVSLSGTWITHKKFGQQFQAVSCTTQTPTSIIGLKKYLSSGLIKGIGKVYGEKLVDFFGTRVLDIIDQEPEQLKRIPGIGAKRIERIAIAWQDQKEIAAIMVFLQEKGITTALATKIYKKYGKESLAVLNENPYRLVEDVWGIGFKTADGIAQKLGLAVDSVKRIKAGICFAMQHASNQGHLYAELSGLKETVIQLLELEANTVGHALTTALHELYNTQTIKLITHQDTHYITLSQFYYSERGVAEKLKKILAYPSPYTLDLDALYRKLAKPGNKKIVLNEEQQKGIMTALQQKITVITGGPGTGKTTLIRQLLELLESQKLTYRLAAPTGRAAKRMTEGTGRQAATLHRLLAFDPSIMGFKHNEHHALELDFLIIDEASMIDIFLANALLKAIPLKAHVLLIGDIDQLPSVGAGNFLRDIIESGAIPYVRLHHIFRQAQNSKIVLNAHRINRGEFPTTALPEAKRDFFYIKEQEPENVAGHLTDIYTKRLSTFGITPDQAVVLVPMNRGIVGTHTINNMLQGLLNPHEHIKPITRLGTCYKVHDRVMQLRNNYDKLVFNGDIGTITAIDHEQEEIHVSFDGRLVVYAFHELDELVLAYALSIHKSQGSEYAACIIPLFMQHFMLLQRNLLYTAITRAKKLCIFIGQPKAIAMGVKNNKQSKRITFLRDYLTSDLSCT